MSRLRKEAPDHQRPVPGMALPFTVQQELVGRERERGALRALRERARDGQGGLVLLAGEAGIGKTALSGVISREAAKAGMLVLSGSCYDLTTTPPYGPWAEVLRDYPGSEHLPEIPAQFQAGGGMEGIDSRAALFDLIGRFLQGVAAAQPLLILLEDLHWADSASLDLLRYLSRTLMDYPALLIVTYRDDEITRDHVMAPLLPALVREGRVHRLQLQRLDRESVLAMARERYRLSAEDEARLMAYLDRLAEGNPFFTNELLYTLEEQQLLSPTTGGWQLGDLAAAGVPTLIQQVINGRLARIDASARGLLEIASVIGYDAALDLLRELHKGSDAALDETLQQALDHHLLVMSARQPSARFSHALVRQTIYEAIPPLRRQTLHLRIGDLLAGRARPELSLVANHLYEAGDDRSIEWLGCAAEQARSLFAPQTVISHAGRGIDLANRLGIDEPLTLYRLRGSARESLGDFDGARSDHELVLERARERGDRHFEWQALLDLGSLWAFQDYERTRAYCEQAVALARTMDDPATLGHSLNGLGNWYTNANLPDEALRHHEEALAIFEQLDDRPGIASTLDLLGVTHYIAGDMTESLRYYERAIPLLRTLDDRLRLSSALGTVFGSAGQDIASLAVRNQALPPSLGFDPRELSLEATEIARSIGSRSAETYALGFLGAISNVRGDLRAGFAELAESLHIAEAIEHRQWTALANQRFATVYLELLSNDLAARYARRALEIATEINSPFFREGSIALLGMAYTRAGLHDEADELLREVVITGIAPTTLTMRSCWLAQAELLLALGRVQEALDIINILIGSVPPGGICLSPFMTKMRGEILIACDQLDGVDDELNIALRAASTIGNRLILWRILAVQRKLYLAQGRIEEADEAGHAALEIINSLADQLDDQERRATFLTNARAQIPGAAPYGPDRASASNYAGLTARELEVLQAVADGLTDAEVGERLFIATRTVSQHLRSVYNKFGINNRAAAVRVAVEQGLV
jgi:DNA-binding CsgD family transcriptional regulator